MAPRTVDDAEIIAAAEVHDEDDNEEDPGEDALGTLGHRDAVVADATTEDGGPTIQVPATGSRCTLTNRQYTWALSKRRLPGAAGWCLPGTGSCLAQIPPAAQGMGWMTRRSTSPDPASLHRARVRNRLRIAFIQIGRNAVTLEV